MNCHQCGKDLMNSPAYTLSDYRKLSRGFCSLGCLQHWIASDLSLTEEKPAAENGGPSPQDVVFLPRLKCIEHGETVPVCPKCQFPRALIVS